MPSSDSKAIAFALLAVLCWSTVATAFKLALATQSIFQLIFTACCVSVVTLSAVLFMQRKLIVALHCWQTPWQTVLLGLLNPVLYYWVLFEAYERLPAQVAQPINYTWAIALSLLSVPILKHTLTKHDMVSLLMGYGGVVLVSVGGARSGVPVTFTGILLALLSTLIWAGYWLLHVRQNQDPVVSLLQNFLVALPCAALMLSVSSEPLNLQKEAWVSALYIGVFEMGLAFVFWTRALQNASRVSKVANLIFISPFLSLLFIHNILEERVSVLTVVGLVVLVIGLLLQNVGKVRSY